MPTSEVILRDTAAVTGFKATEIAMVFVIVEVSKFPIENLLQISNSPETHM